MVLVEITSCTDGLLGTKERSFLKSIKQNCAGHVGRAKLSLSPARSDLFLEERALSHFLEEHLKSCFVPLFFQKIFWFHDVVIDVAWIGQHTDVAGAERISRTGGNLLCFASFWQLGIWHFISS